MTFGAKSLLNCEDIQASFQQSSTYSVVTVAIKCFKIKKMRPYFDGF